MDAVAPRTNGVDCGRRSRVVLMPRRRHQASRKYPRGDGDKKARSPGRVRNKPLKPSRAGMPGVPVRPWRLTRVLTTLRARGCGCNGHPAFPTPSFQGERLRHNSGDSRRENADLCEMIVAGVVM